MQRRFFLRNGANYDVDAASREAAAKVACEGPSMTQKQFKEDADINVLVKRFGLTGEMPMSLAIPRSGDFTGVQDYHSALNQVLAADAAFMQLPGELRARFKNDAGQLLAFLENPANREEAVKLGLVNKPPEVDRAGVVVAEAKPSA